ncbi:unnamed protein product [Paramecium primaurelia]|uniref:Uncharacterized protein n=1 Tax=Paramecium primaurelia TaxID=5886 RepID=A0A8S1L4Z5_PARPR|nr:unnamed protein product [Paramecium primaurelia]
MDLVNQAFKQLYIQDECYENIKDKVDQFPYDEVYSLMEFYVQNYLDRVQNNLYSYSYNDHDSAKFYMEQVNSHWMRIQNIALDQETIVLRYQNTIDQNFKIEYFKIIRQIQHQEIYVESINLINQLNLTFVLQYFNTLNQKLQTHQDLMTNWLTYSQCEQGIDEIEDFEKRLECAMTNLPDYEKQQPKLPSNWEKNIINLMKKKKKKL